MDFRSRDPKRMPLRTESAIDHTFHRSFYIGACLKGLQGILEALGGALLWFLNPKMLPDVAALFVKHELSEYPQNFIVRYIHHAAAHWSLSTCLLYTSD